MRITISTANKTVRKDNMLDCAQEVKDLDGGLARMQVPDELVDGQATDRFMREILNVFMYVLDDKEKRSRKENK